MKYWLIPVILLTFFSCNKRTVSENAKLTDTTANFMITGFADTIVVAKTDSLVLPFIIAGKDTILNPVFLYIEGMPNDVFDSLYVTTDTPYFEDSLLLKTNKSIPGTYSITVYGVDSISGDTVTAGFTLVIPTPGDCDEEIVAHYNCWYGNQWTSNCRNVSQITPLNDGTFRIQLCVPFDSTLSRIDVISMYNLIVDCSKNTLLLPLQTTGVHTYSGSGYYNKDFIMFDYTVNGKRHIVKLIKAF